MPFFFFFLSTKTVAFFWVRCRMLPIPCIFFRAEMKGPLYNRRIRRWYILYKKKGFWGMHTPMHNLKSSDATKGSGKVWNDPPNYTVGLQYVFAVQINPKIMKKAKFAWPNMTLEILTTTRGSNSPSCRYCLRVPVNQMSQQNEQVILEMDAFTTFNE